MSAKETITLPLAPVKAWREWWGDAMDLTNQNPVANMARAVDAALWTPPVSHVEWIDCAVHPHPTDGTQFLAFDLRRGDVWGSTGRLNLVTHWALINLPEVTK